MSQHKSVRYCCQPPRRVAPARPSPHDAQVSASIALTRKRWPNRTVLRYCFVDESNQPLTDLDDFLQTQIDIVRAAWKSWKDLGINLSFQEVTNPRRADIRISFQQGAGSWSAVGMECRLSEFRNQPTMNFGWDMSVQQPETAEHELGHALGLEHEHQNYAAGIEWNRDAVIQDLSGPPNSWDVPSIERNILNKIEERDPLKVKLTNWDRDSIMHYYFKAGLINKPEEYQTMDLVPASNVICKWDDETKVLTSGLSDVDKKFIKLLYPPVGPVEAALPANHPVEIDLSKDAHRDEPARQIDFVFKPEESGKWNFVISGPDDKPQSCASSVVIRERATDRVVYDNNLHYGDDVAALLRLPLKSHPVLNKNDEYVVTALFNNTEAAGTVKLEASRRYKGLFGALTDAAHVAEYMGKAIGQGIRTGITIQNASAKDVQARVAVELFTDSSAWFELPPGQHDRWGRKAGTYRVDILVDGQESSLELTKGGEEAAIVVKGFKQVDVAGATYKWL